MNILIRSAGMPGPLHAPVDWVALGALQERMKNRTDAFGVRCLDEAADRLLSGQAYKHSGEKLAKCLCRDCRRSTRLQSTQPDFLGDDAEALADAPGTPSSAADLEWAADQFADFLGSLPLAARTAFALEVENAPRALILATIGVADRQYRTLRQTCFDQFRANSDTMAALQVLKDAGIVGRELFKAVLMRDTIYMEVAA